MPRKSKRSIKSRTKLMKLPSKGNTKSKRNRKKKTSPQRGGAGIVGRVVEYLTKKKEVISNYLATNIESTPPKILKLKVPQHIFITPQALGLPVLVHTKDDVVFSVVTPSLTVEQSQAEIQEIINTELGPPTSQWKEVKVKIS